MQEAFKLTSGGKDIRSRDPFKMWVIDFQSRIPGSGFHVIEIFQNGDGSVSRRASANRGATMALWARSQMTPGPT